MERKLSYQKCHFNGGIFDHVQIFHPLLRTDRQAGRPRLQTNKKACLLENAIRSFIICFPHNTRIVVVILLNLSTMKLSLASLLFAAPAAAFAPSGSFGVPRTSLNMSTETEEKVSWKIMGGKWNHVICERSLGKIVDAERSKWHGMNTVLMFGIHGKLGSCTLTYRAHIMSIVIGVQHVSYTE